MGPWQPWFKEILYHGGHTPLCHQHKGPVCRGGWWNFILRVGTLLGPGAAPHQLGDLGKQLFLSATRSQWGSQRPFLEGVRKCEGCKVLSPAAWPAPAEDVWLRCQTARACWDSSVPHASSLEAGQTSSNKLVCQSGYGACGIMLRKRTVSLTFPGRVALRTPHGKASSEGPGGAGLASPQSLPGRHPSCASR